jgi:hypothetical protein
MENHGKSMENHGKSMENHGKSMENHGTPYGKSIFNGWKINEHDRSIID